MRMVTKEKARKQFRVVAKQIRFYEAFVWAETEEEAWQQAIEKPEIFEESLSHTDWQKGQVNEV
jgi:hypothetical protein